jgi:hypothetical protein
MTTMFEDEVQCCVCGKKSSHTIIGSTNSFGSADLDTRPPEMQRSTIYYSIQRCTSCGYCSSDISKCDENSETLVRSSKYQGIVKDISLPMVASSFLAKSYENEKNKQYVDAAWDLIHAAWICDDEQNNEAAKNCRKKAVAIIDKASSQTKKIADQAGASELITIDLMRRSGMFESALELAELVKKSDIENIIIQIIEFEITLIQLKDTESHTISEALEKEQ